MCKSLIIGKSAIWIIEVKVDTIHEEPSSCLANKLLWVDCFFLWLSIQNLINDIKKEKNKVWHTFYFIASVGYIFAALWFHILVISALRVFKLTKVCNVLCISFFKFVAGSPQSTFSCFCRYFCNISRVSKWVLFLTIWIWTIRFW